MFKPLLHGLALAAMGLAPLAAQAMPVTYSFAGLVEADDANRGFVAFSGSFSFDSSTPDAIADPSTGAYLHSGAPWGMTLAFDGGAAFTVNSSFSVLVSNDLPGGDQWGLLAQEPAQSISLALYDLGGTLFNSDALPLPNGGLSLASFAWNELRWENADGTLQGRLSSLSCSAGCTGIAPPPVSEPGTLVLAIAGFAALRLARRRTA